MKRRKFRPPEAYAVGIYFRCEVFDVLLPAIACINNRRDKNEVLCIECRQFPRIIKQIASDKKLGIKPSKLRRIKRRKHNDRKICYNMNRRIYYD